MRSNLVQIYPELAEIHPFVFFTHVLLEILSSIELWKNFGNQLAFGKVIAKIQHDPSQCSVFVVYSRCCV